MPRAPAPKAPRAHACPYYHRAVELLGLRWAGVVVDVLLRVPEGQVARFGEIAQAIPEISDRMLTRRLKELRERGVVTRERGGYALTPMGRDLQPAVAELTAWGRRWLDTSAPDFRPA